MLFSVCIEHEYDLIMFIAKRLFHLKSENNCCSVYMNKTFDGHTPNETSSLDLDRSDTHIHNIKAKRCRVDNDKCNLFVALPFRSYWCKAHEETPY